MILHRQSFIHGARSHLGASLPIVLCAIGGADHRVPFQQAVRRAQLAAPSHFPGVACVDASDLEFQADGLHLTAPAQHALGARLAGAWRAVAPEQA